MTYNKETLKNAIVQKLRLNYGCTEQQATDGEMMKACAMVLRDIMAERGVQTREETAHEEKRKVHYLSLDESGTRAAAATVVEVVGDALPSEDVKTVTLDRPFLYMIVDTHACVPLFMGTVTSME